MANINATKKGSMSRRKDCSPCQEESAELTVGEFVSPLYEKISTDNEAPDTYCSVETEPNISYQTVNPAANAVKTDNATRRIDEKYDKDDVSCKRFICILVTITLVTLISLVCLAVLFAEIAKLKSQSVSPQQTSSSQQMQNESVFMLQLEQINKSLTSIQDQITTLSREEMENSAAQSNNIQQLNASIDMQLSTLHNQIQQLNDSNTMLQKQQNNELLRNPLSQFPYPTTSCTALPPSSPSDYYWVTTSNGSPTLVYCTMSCGTLTGGWMRVAFLDMTNSSRQCPSGLMERNDSSNIRTCVRNEASGGCSSVELSTANIQYSTVCGRITAYQVGSTDDFRTPNETINSTYVDGVSLTHGTPRQHIWTFAAAGRMDRTCDPCRTEPRPASVGNDFFCDSGNPMSSSDTSNTFHSANPLWDGDECAGDNECCPTDNPPYFLKTLSQPTTNDIEMRVCRNEGRRNEDIAIETVEIYVQ